MHRNPTLTVVVRNFDVGLRHDFKIIVTNQIPKRV